MRGFMLHTKSNPTRRVEMHAWHQFTGALLVCFVFLFLL